MRHVARFTPSPGVVGKLQVLHALLHTHTWYWHGLHVNVVRCVGPRAAARDARHAAPLDGWPHMQWHDAV
jgi:hypothetical protein